MTAQSAAFVVEPEGDSSVGYPLRVRSQAVYSASALSNARCVELSVKAQSEAGESCKATAGLADVVAYDLLRVLLVRVGGMLEE